MRTLPFSAKAEYACIAMVELAARYGDPQPVPLKAIAEAHEAAAGQRGRGHAHFAQAVLAHNLELAPGLDDDRVAVLDQGDRSA